MESATVSPFEYYVYDDEPHLGRDLVLRGPMDPNGRYLMLRGHMFSFSFQHIPGIESGAYSLQMNKLCREVFDLKPGDTVEFEVYEFSPMFEQKNANNEFAYPLHVESMRIYNIPNRRCCVCGKNEDMTVNCRYVCDKCLALFTKETNGIKIYDDGAFLAFISSYNRNYVNAKTFPVNRELRSKS